MVLQIKETIKQTHKATLFRVSYKSIDPTLKLHYVDNPFIWIPKSCYSWTNKDEIKLVTNYKPRFM